MSKITKSSSFIGRPCVINFACRWKSAQPQFQQGLRAEYEKRDDWNKTGEIVYFDANEHRVTVLRDDDKSLADYYKGEVTITGPARSDDGEIKIITLLTEIRDLLKGGAK